MIIALHKGGAFPKVISVSISVSKACIILVNTSLEYRMKQQCRIAKNLLRIDNMKTEIFALFV